MSDLCPKCGTDHEGYEPGSFGAEIRCLRLQATAAGAGHLVDQVDALQRDMRQKQEDVLRREGFLPPYQEDQT